MLDFAINSAGDLEIRADVMGREHIADNKGERDFFSIWCDLMEHEICNGGFTPCLASDLGGLSEAPVIMERADYSDDGEIRADGRIWAFLDYAMRDELAELAEGETVTFTILKDEG